MKRHILIVEDEVILQKTLVWSLCGRGFEATGVLSVQQAWSVLRMFPIAILLMDLGLPDGDGFEFLEQVRIRYPHMPVIVMTGQEAPDLEERAYQLGAQAFFKKPFPLMGFITYATGFLRK